MVHSAPLCSINLCSFFAAVVCAPTLSSLFCFPSVCCFFLPAFKHFSFQISVIFPNICIFLPSLPFPVNHPLRVFMFSCPTVCRFPLGWQTLTSLEGNLTAATPFSGFAICRSFVFFFCRGNSPCHYLLLCCWVNRFCASHRHRTPQRTWCWARTATRASPTSAWRARLMAKGARTEPTPSAARTPTCPQVFRPPFPLLWE